MRQVFRQLLQRGRPVLARPRAGRLSCNELPRQAGKADRAAWPDIIPLPGGRTGRLGIKAPEASCGTLITSLAGRCQDDMTVIVACVSADRPS